jgi:hypothetical protein
VPQHNASHRIASHGIASHRMAGGQPGASHGANTTVHSFRRAFNKMEVGQIGNKDARGTYPFCNYCAACPRTARVTADI